MDPAHRLEEVVVTPTRRGSPRFGLPFSLETVEAPRLSGVRAPRNLPDALDLVPGVMVQKTGYGQASPYLRGLTGFRTLLLVDGIRLNHAVFRSGPNQYAGTVDNLSLRSVEVVRGPASVLYGSDAMGGALNFLPLVPEAEEGEYGYDGRLYQRFSSAERSSVTRLEVSGGIGTDLGFLGGVDRKLFGDLRAGDGGLDETGYDEWDADLRLIYSPSDELTLTLAYQRVSQNDAPRTHKTVHSRSWHGTTVGNEQRREFDQVRDLLYLRAEMVEPASFADRLTATFSWHHHRETRRRVKSSGARDRQGFTVNSLGFTLQADVDTAVGGLTYGIDVYRDHVESWKKKYDAAGSLTGVSIQGPVADDAVYDLLGAYVQDEIEVSSDLALIAGLRGTYARANAGEAEDPVTGAEMRVRDRWSSVVGSLRAAYRGIEGVNIHAGVSQGFRAPNLSDLTRLDSARSNEIETPSPDLEPERTLTFELGARWRLPAVRGEISLFHSELRDLILRYPTGGTIDGDTEVTKSNVGDGYARGVELAAEVDLGAGVAVFGGAAYMVGKADTYPTSAKVKRREYLDRLPPLTGRIGLRYRHESGLVLEARVKMADKADRLSTRDEKDTQRIPPGGTPGYTVIDFEVTCPVTDFATVSVQLGNLADRAYRIHGSGQNEAGRNVALTLVLRF